MARTKQHQQQVDAVQTAYDTLLLLHTRARDKGDSSTHALINIALDKLGAAFTNDVIEEN